MSKPLSNEEIAILKEAFDAYDTDKGGNITVEEFGRVMKESGQNPSEEQLAEIIKEVDIDGDGTINFDEFIAMMTGRKREPKPETASVPAAIEPTESKPISNPESAPIPVSSELGDSEEDWKAAWKEFDHSLNGSITAAQLRQVVANLGETISDVEVDGIIKSVDAEDKISYKEFAEFMRERNSEVDIIDSY
ncbi:hypothetical protein ACMFMG_007245 [Clarireedia jacksonii]